jgi:hypothetical protein
MPGDDGARRRIDFHERGVVADVEPAIGEGQALGALEAGHPAQLEQAALRAHATDEAIVWRRALAPRPHVRHVELLALGVEDR